MTLILQHLKIYTMLLELSFLLIVIIIIIRVIIVATVLLLLLLLLLLLILLKWLCFRDVSGAQSVRLFRENFFWESENGDK